MPEQEAADEGQVGKDAAPVVADSEGEEPVAFMNRAARRAKGKAAPNPQPQGRGLRAGGRGSVESPRQWGNRRSG
jgi:hypothetical protein